MEVYIFVSEAQLCQESSGWVNIADSYSGVFSLVTCPHVEIPIPKRNACTEITQINAMYLKKKRISALYSCVFLGCQVSVPWVRND